jgi:hypothetical protein
LHRDPRRLEGAADLQLGTPLAPPHARAPRPGQALPSLGHPARPPGTLRHTEPSANADPTRSATENWQHCGAGHCGLIGAVLLEANDEWQLQHRYMGVEAMGEMLSPASTNETLQLPPKSA